MNRTIRILVFAALACAMAQVAMAAGKNSPPTVSLTAPAAGATFVMGQSVALAANAADSDGTVTQVQFFAGTAPVGTDSAAPYTATWTPTAAGTYSLTAKATDDANATTTSAAVTVTVLANAAPTVSITTPANGAGYAAPATITVGATASDADGSVARVDFYQGGVSIGSATSAPFTATWSGVAPGTYTLTAKATDDRGATTTSSAVTVMVGTPPLVVLTQPVDCTVVTPPANVTLAAAAVDTFGWIVKVEFFAGTTLVGTATRKPYAVSWNSVPQGTYQLTARATNNLGLTSDSVPVALTVEPPNTPSTVQVTQPTSGATFRVGNTTTVSATATDPDGVASVVFRDNGALIGSSPGPTYSVPWTVTQVGSHQITATVIDNRDASTTSAAVTVTAVANALPTASLTSPVNNASFREPATVAFAATAADSDGTVVQAEILLDGVSKLTIPGPGPYSGNLVAVPAGTHSVQVRAKDSDNGFGTSNAVTILVAANALPTVQITTPANNAAFDAPAAVTIQASAADSDGTVAMVQFFADGALLGSSSGPTYSFVWNNPPLGGHALTATATDNDGGSRASSPVNITVNGVTAAITAPADGAAFVAPAAFDIVTTSVTTSGGITAVELYDGAALLTTLAVPPGTPTANATFNMSAIAAGPHPYKIIARDSAGRSASSAVVTVNVAPPPSPPTVQLNEPAAGAFYVAPASVRLSANASAGSSALAKVEFFAGSTLVGTATSAPYSATWANVPAGSYSLTAKATDIAGGSAVSSAVPIVVGSASITVDSPLDGAAIQGDSVLVSGTIQASPNSGVTVNDSVAAIAANGRFYLRIPLVAGSNPIAATVTTPGGQTATRTITVNADGVAPAVSIAASPVEGVSPLAVTVSMTNRATSAVAVLANGSAVGTLPAGQSVSFDLSYTGSGTYPLTVTATDAQGIVTSKDFVVVLSDEARLDTMLRAVWGGMTDALTAGDKATAMSYLSRAARDRYGPVFDALAPDLPQIVATWSQPLKGSLAANIAEYAVVTPVGSGRQVFLLYFVRGADGVWRLDSM